MTNIILSPKDIALIAESVLIIAAVIALIVREISYQVRLRKVRRAKAQLPAIRAAQRKRDRERFQEMIRETTYSIEEMPHMSAVSPARKPKA